MEIPKQLIKYIKLIAFVAAVFQADICYPQELNVTVSLPVYNGGLAALKDFIVQNTHHEKPDKNGSIGVVTVSYAINEQGKVENIKILRGINAQCDSEAVKVTKLITGWQPAVQFGKPVSVKVVMPVELYLEEDNRKEQTFTITGNVSNRANGNPIEGTLVLVKDTDIGAVTDKNGYYIIEAPGEEFELEFSSIGYSTKSEKIGKNRTINVELLPEDLIIDFSSKELKKDKRNN